jgi:hypothetical protein
MTFFTTFKSKAIAGKKSKFFYPKLNFFFIPRTSKLRRSLQPSKDKTWIIFTLFYLCVVFALLDPIPQSAFSMRIRIQIKPIKINGDQCRSGFGSIAREVADIPMSARLVFFLSWIECRISCHIGLKQEKKITCLYYIFFTYAKFAALCTSTIENNKLLVTVALNLNMCNTFL